MDNSGRINALGQQYIGAVTPNISSDYQPGVVHGGFGTGPPPPGKGGAVTVTLRTSYSTFVFATIASLLISWVA